MNSHLVQSVGALLDRLNRSAQIPHSLLISPEAEDISLKGYLLVCWVDILMI